MNHSNTSSALKTAMRGVAPARRAVQRRAVIGTQQQERAFIAPAYNLAKKVCAIDRADGERTSG